MKLTKKEARSMIRMKKKETTESFRKKAANECSARLFSTPEWKQAETILTYISYNREMSTFPLIDQAFSEGKRVAAPRVDGKEMEFYFFSSFEELVKSEMNILEPLPNDQKVPEDALMIMPGVAFDEKKNRIGYGGGFYDRYLTDHPEHKKIALAYEFQILEEFETERFDIRPDMILTESRIIL